MEIGKSCLDYFKKPEIVDLLSCTLSSGLEKRLFETFILDQQGEVENPFEILDRENDLIAAVKEGHFGAVKWIYRCMKGNPKNEDRKAFASICFEAASCGRLDILQWATTGRLKNGTLVFLKKA
jgi:hypothetical protein